MTPDELALAIEAKRPELLRVVESMLRPSGMADDAEDFFQDAALRLLTISTEYDFSEEDAVGKLMLTTIMRLLFNRKESVKVRDRGNEDYTRVYQQDSQAHMKQRERLKLDVSLALDRLDHQVALIVRRVYIEGDTWKQAKAELKVGEDTISAALAKAIPQLQQLLAQYDHRQRPTARPVPSVYTAKERKSIADSIRRDRKARQPGPITVTKYNPDGEILSKDVFTISTWRKLHPRPVSASQPPYKEGSNETDSTIPLGGIGHETSPVETSTWDEEAEGWLLAGVCAA